MKQIIISLFLLALFCAPVYSASVTITPEATFIDKKNSGNNNYNNSFDFTGFLNVPLYGGDAQEMHTVYLPQTTSLPTGTTITNAVFRTKVNWFYEYSGDTTIDVKLYALTQSWEPTETTWYKADASTFWTSTLGTLSDTVTVSPADIETFLEFDITSLVSSWINDPASNMGFILLSEFSQSNSAVRFYSDDHSDPASRPYLFIEYSEGGESAVPEPVSIILFALSCVGFGIKRFIRT